MGLNDRAIMSSVRERDIDMMLVQFLSTSPDFRQWICTEFLEDARIKQFLSVSRSVETGNGESDIEFGVKLGDGRQILFLLENKVDATLQDRQAERYHERGTRYVKTGVCDEYRSGIIAPSQYVTTELESKFGTAISYEAVRTALEPISHDSGPFFLKLLDIATEKQQDNDAGYSSITRELADRITDRTEEFPPIESYQRTNNLIRYRSTHPSHPPEVRYQIWIIGNADGREAMVRVSLDSDASDERISEIQSFIEASFTDTDRFEIRSHATMDTVRAYVTANRGASPSNATYLADIVSAFQEITTHFHQKVVDSNL